MKWYLNGFPKAGLHLLDALLKPITQEGAADFAGTYLYNSWAFDRAPIELITNKLTYMPDNHRLLGHSCYEQDLELYLYYAGVAHVFIHRDLRDVAVSQAHHIMSDDDERFRHPDKAAYRALGGLDEVVKACYYGLGNYPGVVARWEQYKTWRETPHTLCLDYDEVIANLGVASTKILVQVLSNHGAISILDVPEMTASARDTSASPTFRRGKPGEWREFAHVLPDRDER